MPNLFLVRDFRGYIIVYRIKTPINLVAIPFEAWIIFLISLIYLENTKVRLLSWQMLSNGTKMWHILSYKIYTKFIFLILSYSNIILTTLSLKIPFSLTGSSPEVNIVILFCFYLWVNWFNWKYRKRWTKQSNDSISHKNREKRNFRSLNRFNNWNVHQWCDSNNKSTDSH